MSLSNVLARVGGFRGLAAGAAIAWGTSQATTIAADAQGRAQLAQEQYAATISMLEERAKELDDIETRYEEILNNMRAEARRAVATDIANGVYDETVSRRAAFIVAMDRVGEYEIPLADSPFASDDPDTRPIDHQV